jgi:dihydrolipoamide dehydrogenase
MSLYAFDCLVIGSGPGGYVAAIRAAQLGLRTAVVERGEVGGRCLNEACIPAKAVLRSADVSETVARAGEFGIETSAGGVNFTAVAARRDSVIAGLTRGVGGLLAKNGVELISGEARLTGPHGVDVGGRRIASKAVIVAAGSRARDLPGFPYAGGVIGTEQAWATDELPSSLAVVGAGPSGTEIASAYARLGSEVVLVEALEHVLPGEDEDISRLAARGLARDGVSVHTNATCELLKADDESVTVRAGEQVHDVDRLVIAVGRAPDTESLGLDRVGIDVAQSGHVIVDGGQRTSVESVFAIGDLVAGPALAHKASEEGVIAAERAAGLEPEPIRHAVIPRVTFSSPNVASFGLSERQASDAGHDTAVGRVSYGAVGAGAVLGERGGLVKVVADAETGKLLGGHVIGAHASELVQQLVIAESAGADLGVLSRTVFGHPTLSEAVLEATRAADGWLVHG